MITLDFTGSVFRRPWTLRPDFLHCEKLVATFPCERCGEVFEIAHPPVGSDALLVLRSIAVHDYQCRGLELPPLGEVRG